MGKPTDKTRQIPKKTEFYIEWWELGTPESAIMAAEISLRWPKPFLKRFMANKKYSLIYLMRKSDNKVIWNRRTR